VKCKCEELKCHKCSEVYLVKCSGVLQCSDGLSNNVSIIIRRLMDNIKLLYAFYEYFYHNIFINVYTGLFLFNNVIYVFLLL
jgi:hypothetical protein